MKEVAAAAGVLLSLLTPCPTAFIATVATVAESPPLPFQNCGDNSKPGLPTAPGIRAQGGVWPRFALKPLHCALTDFHSTSHH